MHGVAAAYLPGERVDGLWCRSDGRLEVHVVMRWGTTVDAVEREVLAALGDGYDAEVVDLVIDDLELDGLPPRAPVEPR
jgi:hypothetical protein